MTTRPAAALAAIGLLLVTACSGATGADAPVASGPPPTIVPLPSDLAPTATPTSTPTPTPTATPTPTETADDDVVRAQTALADAHYYVGAIDGKAGPATASAVQAFQKVNGLQADGVIGPNTLAAMADSVEPALVGGPATRIEVDLDTQVLVLVENGAIARIVPVSSGSGETYRTAGGGTARSVTPVGTFTVERRIDGIRDAPLGRLYDPMYFHGGWAIHGSNSVPAYPASHGCVRVTRADARWLFDRVSVGIPVIVHGDLNAFDPSAGESAGTSVPAGDTPDTTPPDGIQTPEPTPPAGEPEPTTPPDPAPTSQPRPTIAPEPTPQPPIATESPRPTPDPAAPGVPPPADPV